MDRLAISEAGLEERRKKLPRRLRRLVPQPSYVQAIYHPLGPFISAIALHQGQRAGLSHEEYRISLLGVRLSVAYYEIWRYVGALGGKRRRKSNSLIGSDYYRLEKAYLHIFTPKPSGQEEKVLFFHCDPQESRGSKHFRYKASPHLHLEIAGDPWRRAHIPLCDGWQHQVLENLDTLDTAITRVVDFVADQVIPLVREN